MVLAQANSGITGTVTDASGAVVPGAEVVITNQGTSVSTRTVTSSSGTYTATGLVPGQYTVAVTAQGFKKSVQTSVHVEVTTQSTINFSLATGAASETVEVTADPIALNTTQPQLGTTIEPEVVKALPNEVGGGRGRQIDSFIFLAPGVQGDSFSHRVNGGTDFQNEVLFNGIPYSQAETEGYTTIINPPYEMVHEFRVERTTFSAQFGLGQGAITYQMASGTNQFHGDLFEINRNSFFDSKGFFNEKVPTDHENNYGFTVGGPVWIPKVYRGQDRTFFHFSLDFYKQNAQDTRIGTVPTPQEKQGDFSNYVDANGKVIPIYDPLTGNTKQFEYNGKLNVIPPGRLSAVSAPLVAAIPDPDRPGTGVGGLDSNKTAAPNSIPNINHSWGFTLDHNLTDKQSLHYSQWRNRETSYSFDNAPIVNSSSSPIDSYRYLPYLGTAYLLSYANSVTPHLVTTAGFGWIGELNQQYPQGLVPFPGVAGSIGGAGIAFDGQHAMTNFGTSQTALINRKLGISFVNNWLWTKGRNTFNIGGEARRTYQDDTECYVCNGQFNFSQRNTSTAQYLSDGVTPDPNFNTYGSSFASFLLGEVDSANRTFSQEVRLRNFALSPYIQDDIKMTTKLTVNLGIRWDIMVPFTANDNNIAFFDPATRNPAAGNLLGAATKFGNCDGCAGYTRADIHWAHFGPRIGMAYQINNKTVIQGGYSIAFLNGGAYEFGTSKVGVNYSRLLAGQFTRGSTGGNVPGYGNWDQVTMPIPPNVPFSPSIGTGQTIQAFSKNDGYAPYSQQWNINVQRELPWNVFLQLAYVGNREVHLPGQLNTIDQQNPSILKYGPLLAKSITDPAVVAAGFTTPYPNFVNDFGSSATLAQALAPYPQYAYIQNNFDDAGSAYYKGLQGQLEKRFTNGLSFLVAYTLSRTMSNVDSGFSTFASVSLNKYNQKQEWAVAANDQRQNAKISGTYELPIGPGRTYLNNKGVTGQVLGGWQIGWIAQYVSATTDGISENGNPWAPQQGFNRPDRVSSVPLHTRSYDRVRKYFVGKASAADTSMFDPAAFKVTPSQYVLGNAARNYVSIRGTPVVNENLNAQKHFAIGDHVRATLQVDYFNAFNRTRFCGPNTNASDPAFTQDTSACVANGNRQGQASLRLEF